MTDTMNNQRSDVHTSSGVESASRPRTVGDYVAPSQHEIDETWRVELLAREGFEAQEQPIDGSTSLRQQWDVSGRRVLGDHWDYHEPKDSGIKHFTINKVMPMILAQAATMTEQDPTIRLAAVQQGEEPLAIYLKKKAGRKIARMMARGVVSVQGFTPGQLTGDEPVDIDRYEVLTEPDPETPMIRPPLKTDDFWVIDDKTIVQAGQKVFDLYWTRCAGNLSFLEMVFLSSVFGHQPWLMEIRAEPFGFILSNPHVANVYIDPNCTKIEDAEYLIYDQLFSTDRARMKFPKYAPDIDRIAESGSLMSDRTGIPQIGRQYVDTAWQRRMLVIRTVWERNWPFPLEPEDAIAQGKVVPFNPTQPGEPDHDESAYHPQGTIKVPWDSDSALQQGILEPMDPTNVSDNTPGAVPGGAAGGGSKLDPTEFGDEDDQGKNKFFTSDNDEDSDQAGMGMDNGVRGAKLWSANPASPNRGDRSTVGSAGDMTDSDTTEPPTGEYASGPSVSTGAATGNPPSVDGGPGMYQPTAGNDADDTGAVVPPAAGASTSPNVTPTHRLTDTGEPVHEGHPLWPFQHAMPDGRPLVFDLDHPPQYFLPNGEPVSPDDDAWPMRYGIRQAQFLRDAQRIIDEGECEYCEVPMCWTKNKPIQYSPYGQGEPIVVNDLQQFINRLATTIYNIVRWNAYPAEILPKSLKQDLEAAGVHFSARPNQSIGIEDATFDRYLGPEGKRQSFHIQPMPLPDYAIKLLSQLMTTFDQLGGNVDVLQGRPPGADDSGVALAQLTANAKGPLGFKSKFAEDSLARMGRLIFDAIMKFAPEDELAKYFRQYPPHVWAVLRDAMKCADWDVQVELVSGKGANKAQTRAQTLEEFNTRDASGSPLRGKRSTREALGMDADREEREEEEDAEEAANEQMRLQPQPTMGMAPGAPNGIGNAGGTVGANGGAGGMMPPGGQQQGGLPVPPAAQQ